MLGRFIALLVGLVFLGLLEFGLRVLDIGPEDSLFTAEGNDYRLNPHAARRFFPHQYVRLAAGQDRFAREKDADTFRVFALGASTLLGFPNPAHTSFPNFLQMMLQDAYPEREIEVVNCGITAINSFVLLDFVAEIADRSPDLVIIYAGHNEFVGPYGAATPFVRLGGNGSFIRLQMIVQRSKIYYVLGEILHGIGEWLSRDEEPTSFGLHLVQREINLGDEAHRRTAANFRRNLAQILSVLHERDIPVALSTLVANLEGFYPLRSEGAQPPIGQASQSMVDDYPRHAALHFEAGVSQLAAGDSSAALASFVQARDLDTIHLRACSPFNQIIRELAADPDVLLVDVERTFSAHAPRGLIGDELITEYLHPTVLGHYLIAHSAFSVIAAHEKKVGLDGRNLAGLALFNEYTRRLGYGTRDQILARNDLILLLRNMPYAESPPILERRLAELIGVQLRELPSLSYAQIANFARRGGFAFLAEVIAGLNDAQHLADELEALAGPLGFAP